MAKSFDATTKQIVEVNPQDWLALLGFPRLPVEVIDADLATVTTDADRILRTLHPPFSAFHFTRVSTSRFAIRFCASGRFP